MAVFSLLQRLADQKYERYLPTAFDESLSILEKVNKTIEYLNQTIDQTNVVTGYVDETTNKQNADIKQVRNDFEGLKRWLESDGLQEQTSVILNEWFGTGKLADIINNEVFNMKANQVDLDLVKAHLSDISVNVKMFGAVGDGVTDDGSAIRTAYAHLKSLGGGELYFPKSKGDYLIKSTVNVGGKNVGLNHDSDNISFRSPSDGVQIKAGTSMHAIVYGSKTTNFLSFKNITLLGAYIADYCFNTADDVYTPFLNVETSRFYQAKEHAFKVATYVSTFNKSFFGQSKLGLLIQGVAGNIATSVTVNSCYAINNTEVGFQTRNLMYSSFSSCAVDHLENGIGYDIEGRGVTLTSCGAEKVRQLFKSNSFRGFSIVNFYGFNVGSIDPLKPTEYLFEFGVGENADVTGLQIQNGNDRHYKYKLGLTKADYGFENITVLDGSVNRDEIYFVKNYTYDSRPIKLLRHDETNKAVTRNVAPLDLVKEINKIEFLKLNHHYTIKVGNGSTDQINVDLKRLDGKGLLVIEGNANNNELVMIDSGFEGLKITNNVPTIIIKNLCITSTFDQTFAIRTIVDNSTVIFDNCKFLTGTDGVRASSAIKAINNARVYLINGTHANDTPSWFENAGKIFNADKTSKIIVEDMPQKPTYGKWANGMRLYNSNPSTGGFDGWRHINGVWKGFGIIEQ